MYVFAAFRLYNANDFHLMRMTLMFQTEESKKNE